MFPGPLGSRPMAHTAALITYRVRCSCGELVDVLSPYAEPAALPAVSGSASGFPAFWDPFRSLFC